MLHPLRLCVLFLLTPFLLKAQPFEVVDGATNPYDPINLITNIFLGEGVEVLNVEYTGADIAVGFFKNGDPIVGIDRGLVMTTGRVTNSGSTLGIPNPGSSFASSNNGSIGGDPDLAAIATGGIFNPSKYVITFIPSTDTIRFRYVFASEEYPEYACTSFNDVFGFFISGPGINGPFTNNAQNIALIPGTSLNVSINNIHPQNGGGCPPVNEQFYINNNGMSTLPVYDGRTHVFTAEAVVIPCETYTIKLVLADVGDSAFDTGVFLEAKSFGSPSLKVEIITESIDGTITEGCSDAILSFYLPGPAESDYPIDYIIFGTAENGVDYTTIPPGLFIPAGDSVVTIPIHAFEDGIAEGAEFIGIDVQRDFCNRDTFYIPIRENGLIPPELGPDHVICLLDTILLDGTLNIPLPPPPSFTNNTEMVIGPPFTNVFSPVLVSGVQPFQLGPGVIQSVCINVDHNWLSDLDIYLVGPNGLFMELTTDNGSNGDDYINTCFTPDATIPIDYIQPPASGAPYTGNFQPEGVWSDLWSGANNPTNGEWKLLCIDDAFGFEGKLLDWTITFNPAYQVFYEWTPSAGLSCADCPDPRAYPATTTTYVLRAYDSYGCETYDTITIEVKNILPAPVVDCGSVTNDCITFVWSDVPGAQGYIISFDGITWAAPNGTLSHTVCGLTYNETLTILVRAVDECDGLTGMATCTTPDCDSPTPSILSIDNASCFGASDGGFALQTIGPDPPFSYTLGGVTNATGIFGNLAAGQYTVTVSNTANCPTTIAVTVGQPPAIGLTELYIQPISCNGAGDGILSVSVSGGSYPYSYEWTGGATDSLVSGLSAGMIEVTVTDANGCQSIGQFNVQEPGVLELLPTNNFIACSGDNSGEASVAVSGGTMPFEYLWDAAAGSQTTPTASGLTAGAYSVVVTDANGCQETAAFLIDENAPVVLSAGATDATCNSSGDGTASVTASGGVGVFFYQWDAAANNQTTATATGLNAGTFWVTVTDALGCIDSISTTVTAPNPMIVSIQTDPTSCHDSADGFGEVLVSGGSPGYIFEWSDGGPGIPVRNNLTPGAQAVTITDANNCVEVISFEIVPPAAITLDLSATLTSCFSGADGTATALAGGGVGGFQYLWSNAQQTPSATGLSAGTAFVTVTDANGCEAFASIEVGEPAELQITSLTAAPALCFGTNTGSAAVTAIGGTGAYTYLWNDNQQTPTANGLPAGPASVVVTDANGCTATQSVLVGQPTELTTTMGANNLSCSGAPDGSATVAPTGGTPPYSYLWNNGQTSQTAVNLPAGMALVTVTDANGCPASNSVMLSSPEPLVISIQGTNVSCNAGQNGTASVEVSSGTPPFVYTWSNAQTGLSVSGLSAGAYSVTVTDASGCEATASLQITQPDVLSLNLNQTGALCNNTATGSALVAGIFYGPTPANPANFTYLWNSSPAQTTANATGLMGGQTYSVTITDPAGCVATQSIAIGNPPPIDIFVVATQNASCFDGKDGTASVGANGGSPPYAFVWSPGASGQTGPEAIGLTAGTFGVTVTDAQGCSNATTAIVGQPTELKLGFSFKAVACFGGKDGAATAIPSGGTAPYIVSWSTGQGGFLIDALQTGLYSATVTDAKGCSVESDILVPQPQLPIIASFTTQDVSCHGGADGSATFETYGGTPLYSYSLDGVNYYGSPRIFGLLPGEYNVFIRDANGCEYISDDVLIGEPDPLVVDLGPNITVDAGQVVQLSANVTHSNGALTYIWESISPDSLTCYDCPETSTLRALFNPATFRLTVIDENGCEGEDIIRILVSKDLPILVPTAFSPNGDGVNDRLLVHGRPGTRVFLFQVFDRWGELVYDARNFPVNDPDIGWDGFFKGQLMNGGAFIWYAEVIFEDGSQGAFKGTTTLIR
jgi:gliding motility-associated-like protein